LRQLPGWFKQEIPGDDALALARLLSESGVRTVCQEAKCPNLSGCFKNKQATFLILGPRCSRACRFCNIGTGSHRDDPGSKCHCEGEARSNLFRLLRFARNLRDCFVGLRPPRNDTINRLRLSNDTIDEPFLISEAVKKIGLRYVVITSVTRDDLTDGGARQFAETIKAIREIGRKIKIEVLIPDFQGKEADISQVLDAAPDVIAHNMETVSRLYADLRPQADYRRSLGVLARIKQLRSEIITKSSLMLGLGETEEEVIEAMRDLQAANCDILTLGQYLAPSPRHYPVKEFVSPEKFKRYNILAKGLGFKSVLSGPLARSSYQAEKMLIRSYSTANA